MPSHPPWCSETDRQDQWCHGSPGRGGLHGGDGGSVCRMGRRGILSMKLPLGLHASPALAAAPGFVAKACAFHPFSGSRDRSV